MVGGKGRFRRNHGVVDLYFVRGDRWVYRGLYHVHNLIVGGQYRIPSATFQIVDESKIMYSLIVGTEKVGRRFVSSDHYAEDETHTAVVISL